MDTSSFRQKYTAEASAFYRQKMMNLIANDPARKQELRGYIPDGKGGVLVELPATLMYRIDTLVSADNHRLYEFVIEYDVDTPAEGIYYGCRGITVMGNNHPHEIECFRQEREIVLPEICQILNNTFPHKDFSFRFKLADNADNNTYWLFWLTLNEEEDIMKVGLTAATIIRNVFRRYLNAEQLRTKPALPKHLEDEPTCFTNDTYRALLASIRSINGRREEDPHKTALARDLFEKFIIGAEHQRILAVDPNYERAWRFLRKERVEFARMMYAFFVYLQQQELFYPTYQMSTDTEIIQVPWTALLKVFLDKDGEVYTQAIKTQVMKRKQSEVLEKAIDDWIKTIQSCINN